MKPINFPEVNVVLQKPKNMNDSECGALPIFRTPAGCCISCWKPTWKEIFNIFRSRKIWIWVWSGTSQPPIAIDTSNPFSTKVAS